MKYTINFVNSSYPTVLQNIILYLLCDTHYSWADVNKP